MASQGGAAGGGGGAGAPVLYGKKKEVPKIMKRSTNKNANKADLSAHSFNQFAGKPVTTDRSAPAWGDKDARLMKRMNVADELKQKVDLRMINLEIIMPWITKRICELMGVEDDVVILFVKTQLEEGKKAQNGLINPKQMQVFLMGFLEKNTSLFMKELWQLLLSAQSRPDGIPIQFIEEKERERLEALAELEVQRK